MKTELTYRPGRGMVLFLLMLFVSSFTLQSQDEPKKKARPKHRLNYVNLVDSSAYLQSYLYTSSKGVKTEIEGVAVQYFLVNAEGAELIGEAVSDRSGKTVFVLPVNLDELSDTAGNYYFLAQFEGNDDYKAKDADLHIRSMDLSVDFKEEDSIRSIRVLAVDPMTGEKIEDIDVNFYVERMFLPLKIGEESTNRKGIAELEFPDDIPGDTSGALNLLVKVEDNDVYGSFTASISRNWGVPVEHNEKFAARNLWTTNAPMWMVVTFVILMGLVWGHFLAIMVMLFLVEKETHRKKLDILWDT